MLYPRFASFLDRNHKRGHRLVLALSGGLDSRVLLHLLHRYSQTYPENPCTAIHVHHGLSPNADQWAQQCLQWCEALAIPVLVEHVELELEGRVSIEQEARDKRYQALTKHLAQGDSLLTGQHLADQSETFLLALKRGSGPKGLASMPARAEFASGSILRPLLDVSREAIQSYAREHELCWIEDESNQDVKFDRNFLRHQVMPVLKQRWPGIESAISRSAGLCAEQELLLEELLGDRLTQLVSADGSLLIDGLLAQSERARNQLLRLWLARKGSLMPSQKQLALIWQEVALAREDANPKLVLASGEVRRFQGRLYLVEKSQDLSYWQSRLPLEQTVVLPDGLGELLLTSRGANRQLRMPLPGEQWQVGFAPEGLTAHPEGRAGSRNLKKLFQEYGVPSWLRRRTPILLADGQVAAVAGLFVDKAFSGSECELVWKQVQPFGTVVETTINHAGE